MIKISPAAHVSLASVPTWGMVDARLRNLHKEHAAFILRLLSWCCGVRGCDAEDVAQLVWLQVHRLGPAPELETVHENKFGYPLEMVSAIWISVMTRSAGGVSTTSIVSLLMTLLDSAANS